MPKILSFIVLAFLLCPVWAVEYTVASGFRGGTYFQIAQSLKSEEIISGKIISTRGSVANLELIGKGRADIGLCQVDIMANAFQYSPESSKKVAMLMPVYGEEVHIISATGVKDTSSFEGRKISIGAPRSGTRSTARIILGALGLDDTKIIIDQSSTKDGLAKLQKKKVDVLFVVAGSPVQLLAGLSPNQNISFVEFKGGAYNILTGGYFPYRATTLKPGTYSWQKNQVQTISVFSALVVKRSMADSEVERLLSTIFTKKAALSKRHDKWHSLNMVKARQFASDKEDSRYFHRAALRFFKEK